MTHIVEAERIPRTFLVRMRVIFTQLWYFQRWASHRDGYGIGVGGGGGGTMPFPRAGRLKRTNFPLLHLAIRGQWPNRPFGLAMLERHQIEVRTVFGAMLIADGFERPH